MKIIIVDDEELAQIRLKRMLLELGYKHIEVAFDAYAALELIKKNHFDLIFLDINMPHMNGLELGRKIKSLFQNRAVIYQSAYNSHALDAFEVGAVGYLVKPYSMEQLKQSIERVQTKEQEYLAKDKVEAGIVNDLDAKESVVFYKAADILSGDFYSIYRLKNGLLLICLIDAQGHGISPALTVFAISSMLNKFVYEINSLQELIEKNHPIIQTFLAEIEQLSYTIIMIDKERESLDYASGGMYPFLIKKGDEILRVKANNPPFMNFSPLPKLSTISIEGWQSLLLYSDGLTEHGNDILKEFTPDAMIQNPSVLKEALTQMQMHPFEDDVTLVYITNDKIF